MGKLKTGLLSVTFRQLTPVAVIELVSQAGLQVIEWGGDIHVPHGDSKAAAEVGKMTSAAGIEVASYGSYYQLVNEDSGLSFDKVLDSAIILQAPAIRVWAGKEGSSTTSMEERQKVVSEARRIASLAQQQGITIDFEYHGGTLTDCTESAVKLMQEIAHPNVRCNWQAPTNASFTEGLEGLKAILPYLANVHVFYWKNNERLTLTEGEHEWLQYLEIIQQTGRNHSLMLEFVKDDAPEQFLADAKSLTRLLGDLVK